MGAAATAAQLQNLTTDFIPESEGGVRIFRNISARGRDVIDWTTANPGMLESSRWIECDLDKTEWPEKMRDVEFVDCSLRNAVWHFIEAYNIGVKGTKRISMHYDAPHNRIVANLDNVVARIDGMKISGQITGLNLLRVAGSDVVLGDPPPGFYDQTELPLKFGGNPIRLDSSSIQLCYLERFTVYLDGEDVSIHKNGLPDFSFGGTSRRCDLSRNVAP